eukprot:SM000039S14437  [mRNA]  locus=s39:142817:144657:- [translate_table: standard]
MTAAAAAAATASSPLAAAALARRCSSALASASRASPAAPPLRAPFLGSGAARLLRRTRPQAEQSAPASLRMKGLFGGPFGNSRAAMSTESNSVALGPDDDVPLKGTEFATFGAGCFWGVELAFQRVPGVVKTEVGYAGGKTDQPRYEEVCGGRTGHAEVVRVQYNPQELGYDQLLSVLWKRHDPTQLNRQGNDVGTQYRSAVYFYSPEQEKILHESIAKEEARIGRKIVTEVKPAPKFYPAESYHQQYLEKGGRIGRGQSAAKGCSDPIRCYG